jgi:hypothetical protein
MNEPFCWCCLPKTPVIHPPRLKVYRLDGSEPEEPPWHWVIRHYEDRSGVRYHIVNRWGQASRWEDAFSGGLTALARELGYEPVVLGREVGES